MLTDAASTASVFEASMSPHRSLTYKGARTIIGVLCALSGLLALRFWLLGAWPVAFFSFVDVPLVALLLALNFRGARATESLLLTERDLTITRRDPKGRQSTTVVPTAWLQLHLDGGGASASRIVLVSRGRRYEVGIFLHEPERIALYSALKKALHTVNNPVFDNPQLRTDLA
jgi:uncharacterized membrane protein